MTPIKPSAALMQRLRAPRRPRTKADFEWIGQSVAEDELVQAFALPSAVASMLLHGLVATGTVRVLDNDGNVIDLDECKIWEFEGKIKSVAANELRDWIGEHSSVPQGHRDRLIAQKLQEGINPPRNKSWKEFYILIRDGCGGWIGNGAKRKPAWGFGDKQIQRVVKDLKQR
jgi:hypothetical protein